MFRSSHFSFLVTFGNKITKIQKNYIIFVYILQGKMGKIEQNVNKITQLNQSKYRNDNQKTKIWDERNKSNKQDSF